MSAGRPYKLAAYKVHLPGFSVGHLGSRPIWVRSYGTAAARDKAAVDTKLEGITYLGSTLRYGTGFTLDKYELQEGV